MKKIKFLMGLAVMLSLSACSFQKAGNPKGGGRCRPGKGLPGDGGHESYGDQGNRGAGPSGIHGPEGPGAASGQPGGI